MSLRTFSLLAALLSALATPLLHAGPYAKLSALYNQPSDLSVSNAAAFRASLKNNLGIAGALGYKFSLLRLEAELQHANNKAEADEASGTLAAGVRRTFGSLKQTSGFANAYVDLPSFFGLSPYFGAGLGYARFNVSDLGRTNNNVPFVRVSGRDSVFGYQGMLGLQFHLFGTATLNGGFRLVRHDDIEVQDVLANARQTLGLGTHRVFELGVALGF